MYQITRKTQRTTTSNLNAIQPTFQRISRPQAFWAAIFSKYPLWAILLLLFFSEKVNQIIRNNQRTTTSNLNAIQPTFHMISRPQAFWADIFSKCPPSAILFLMNSSQKLSEIEFFPKVIRNTQRVTYKIWMESIQRLIRYRAHKLFGRPSWKMAAYGIVTKQYMGRIAQAHRSCL